MKTRSRTAVITQHSKHSKFSNYAHHSTIYVSKSRNVTCPSIYQTLLLLQCQDCFICAVPCAVNSMCSHYSVVSIIYILITFTRHIAQHIITHCIKSYALFTAHLETSE